MTAYAQKLIAKHDAAKPKKAWFHRLHGFRVEVVNKNLFGNVLVKMPGGNMIEIHETTFKINYEERNV